MVWMDKNRNDGGLSVLFKQIERIELSRTATTSATGVEGGRGTIR